MRQAPVNWVEGQCSFCGKRIRAIDRSQGEQRMAKHRRNCRPALAQSRKAAAALLAEAIHFPKTSEVA